MTQPVATHVPLGAPTRRQAWEHKTNPGLLALSVLFLATYAWRVLAPPELAGLHQTLVYTDIAIWLVFATDYALRLKWSTDRLRFIVRHPFDALVVVVPPLRPLLLVRAALMLAGTLNRVWETRIRLAALVGVGSPLVLLLGGLAFYDAEHGAANSHVQSFDDALWWAAVTVTTVGYGDIYPVTGAGRLVSLVLMFLGIGLISFAIGTATSWVIDQLKTVDEEAVRTDQLVQELSAQIQHLRSEMAALRAALTPPSAPAPHTTVAGPSASPSPRSISRRDEMP